MKIKDERPFDIMTLRKLIKATKFGSKNLKATKAFKDKENYFDIKRA